MGRDFESEKLVENSTMSMLQSMADAKNPADFLKLLGLYRRGTPLDDETAERFKRMGLLDPTGNIPETTKEALEKIRFVSEKN